MTTARRALTPALLTVFALAVLLAGCGAQTPTAYDQTDPVNKDTAGAAAGIDASQGNPVELLKKVPGCSVPASVKYGDLDAWGNRFAECEFDNKGAWSSGTSVRVYMGDIEKVRAQGVPEQLLTTDSSLVFYGDGFTGRIDGFAREGEKPVPIEPILKALNAKLVPQAVDGARSGEVIEP